MQIVLLYKEIGFSMAQFIKTTAIAALIALSVLNTGCSTTSSRVADSHPPIQPDHDEELYQQALQQNLLYQTLLAETAFKNGQLDLAAKLYLNISEKLNSVQASARATEIALYANNSQVALAAATRWSKISPEDAKPKALLVIFLLKNHQPLVAVPYLEQIYVINHDNIADYLILIASQLHQPQEQEDLYTAAMAAYDKYSNNSNSQFMLAFSASKLGDYAIANKYLDQALKTNPNWLQAIVLKTQVLLDENKIKDALQYLAAQIKRQPDNYPIRWIYAELLQETNQIDLSKKQYAALTSSPLFQQDALLSLGELAFNERKWDEAKKYFSEIIEIDSSNGTANYYLGEISLVNHNIDEALAWYNQVQDQNYYLPAHIKIVMILMAEGQTDSALQELHQLVALFPNESKIIYVTSGQLLLADQQPQAAWLVVGQGLKESPDDVELLYFRGIIAANLKKYDLAEQDLRHVLQLQPNHAPALNALGFALTISGTNYNEALQLIQKANQLDPNNPIILDSLGWVEYHLGKTQTAIDHLQQALTLMPDPEIAAHLGEALWSAGDKKDAIALWRSSLKSNPDHKLLQETMQRYSVGP